MLTNQLNSLQSIVASRDNNAQKYKNFRDKLKLQQEIQRKLAPDSRISYSGTIISSNMKAKNSYVNQEAKNQTYTDFTKSQLISLSTPQKEPYEDRKALLKSTSIPKYKDWRQQNCQSTKEPFITDEILDYTSIDQLIEQLTNLKEGDICQIPISYISKLEKLQKIINDKLFQKNDRY